MEQEPHMTVVWAWLKTVVMLKHPGHLTSMKKLFGDWTSRVNFASASPPRSTGAADLSPTEGQRVIRDVGDNEDQPVSHERTASGTIDGRPGPRAAAQRWRTTDDQGRAERQ
eukprot:CAMPEP_0118892202 /NCGR_PEP_ID=MMETSP1166-20130328/1897_1 /TAXON_ID=1104430 /ORGANISM="Chrysoreinhardia sp, Strain CCMP3193" /LENGTH=111 /DNA_ID=CAMNT_0006830903 /DNA_START=139 /DNA_END=472 /DNA_ORIENTATION=-